MMIRATNPFLISDTIYFNKNVQRNYEVEQIKDNEKMKEILKEEMQKVQPIYNTQGKVISHNKNGKRLDISV